MLANNIFGIYMLTTPIIIAYETFKKDKVIKIYAIIEDTLEVTARIIKLDNYKTPADALISTFREDGDQEQHAARPFSLPHDAFFVGDKKELMAAFYKVDMCPLEDSIKFLDSVEVCLMTIFGTCDMISDVRNALQDTRLLGGYRVIRKFCIEGKVEKAAQ